MTELVKTNAAGVPLRALGRTGLDVSIIGLGGGHLSRKHLTEADSIRLVQLAVDEGITFMDNAWDYWDGESERRMGKALQGRRDDVVLMTKVCGRDRETAEQHLHDSLERLQTDVIDVWQFHEINYDNDPEWVFRAEGAIEAAVAAQKAGKVRFVGFTGHKSPHILKSMLDMDFPWDTCQIPTNVVDYHFRSFTREVLPLAVEREIGIIGMKSLGGDAQIIKGAGLTAEECRAYALSLPISTLVCGIESEENIRQDAAIAREFVQASAGQLDELRERVREHATDGRYEWFKTTQYYDSKVHRVQHGFPEELPGR
ncbi:MAG: aldo/keto reductase [Planctomycetaceae bacterium]|nr:aldo/keto reductase [Planctomycetaceae bacterium]